MLKHERHQFILSKLLADQKVAAASLSRALGISEVTVRRDLSDLEAQGKLRKVHGGAVLSAQPVASFRQRLETDQTKKNSIAQKAVALLNPGQVIAVDGSTTNLALVKLLPADFPATIITNCPTIAQQFSMHAYVQVLLAGGTYDKHTDTVVGATACQLFREVYTEVCFLGVCGLHHRFGVTSSFYEEALVKQIMVQQAAQVVAMVSADKIETVDHYKVCDIQRVSTLVTDLVPTHEQLAIYREHHHINIL